MHLHNFVCLPAAALILASATANAEVPAAHSARSGNVEFAGVLASDLPPHDRWHPSLRVRLEVEVRTGGKPNIMIHRPDGELLAQHTVWFPGAMKVHLYTAAYSPDGAVAVLGYTAAQGQVAGLVILLDQPTAQPKVVRLEERFAIHARFAPDGTLWAFMAPLGRVLDTTRGPITHEVLWQIGMDGRIMRKVLPFSDLSLPQRVRSVQDWNSSRPGIAVSASHVFLYVPFTAEIVKTDFEGGIVRRIPLVDILGQGPHSLARFDVSPSGILAASLSTIAAPRRFGTLLLDLDAAAWKPLRHDQTAPDEQVCGFEGESLITASWNNRAIYRHALK